VTGGVELSMRQLVIFKELEELDDPAVQIGSHEHGPPQGARGDSHDNDVGSQEEDESSGRLRKVNEHDIDCSSHEDAAFDDPTK
jgi:hypothetical protein